MDTEPGANRRERVIDWLASHPDLPHLFARLSELVHVHGYDPEDLVVLPRSEIDRRETTAFTSGWAEAVSDELPRIRREYEKRVADAYAQGQGDARGIRRPPRRAGESGQDGARIIALPFARLLEPPAAVVEAEERVRREREMFERRGERIEPSTSSEPSDRTEPADWPETVGPADRADQADQAGRTDRPERQDRPDRPEPEPEHATGPEHDAEPDVLLTAQESRARRNVQPVRRVARRKGGRPIVPPLAGVPGQTGSAGERRASEPGDPEGRGGKGRRLSDRARALEEDLATGRAQEAPPESAP
ncbi:hypothetical protein GCM10022244_07670 [Streptomyces gulbargensis]|uniref:Uncharacterized protein n=1 Tax=Streptomyces gulbargensis TaxID=364901 RepID=A0ABP7LFX5_9ACTN